uniref:IF rod domain-containing protein n=1 Tax=Pavo cristatus TaxID=9049 RepID=A0A8C9FC91_PAVCR
MAKQSTQASPVASRRGFGAVSTTVPIAQSTFSSISKSHSNGGSVGWICSGFDSRSLPSPGGSKRISGSRGHCSATSGCSHSACDGGLGFGRRCGHGGIQGIVVNPNLLVSINLEISPSAVTLTSRFASFISKAQLLEQHHEGLETTWGSLQEQKCYNSNSEPTLGTSTANWKRQRDVLGRERAKLATELSNMQGIMEGYKKTEVQKKKKIKDVECFFLNKAELGAKVGRMEGEFDFLRVLYEESHQLRVHISDTAVVVQMDNSRDPDLDGIVANVKAHYKDTACRSRAETEAWCKGKFEELRVTAGRNADSLQQKKKEAAELTRVVKKLSGEVRSAKEQCCKLETAVADAEQRKETSIKEAKSKLTELEAALQKAKQDLAQQLWEFQELMNIKLALDIEITTYRKLLEGEESRWVAETNTRPFRSMSLPFTAVCHSQGGLAYSPAPGFAGLANGSSCLRSGSTHVKVVSMGKSTM